MNILGIHYGHNASITIFKDNKIIFCQSEERLNRLKNSNGFPYRTLDFVYKNIILPEEIDFAVCSQQTVFGYLYLKQHNFSSFENGDYLDPILLRKGIRQKIKTTNIGWKLQEFKIKLIENKSSLLQERDNYFSQNLRIPTDKIVHLNHHLAHAYSTVPNITEWDQALIFTLDGVGDWTSATVNTYKNGEVKYISKTNHLNSFGYFYSAITQMLGMKAGAHEFKVMGLAPYANRKYYQSIMKDIQDIINVNDSGEWVSKIFPSEINSSLEPIIKFKRFDNIAGAIQELTEILVVKWVDYWIKKTDIHNVALSGGVFMNVKVNQKVLELDNVSKLYVMPSAADESSTVGCVYWGAMNLKRRNSEYKIEPLTDLYLGINYSDEQIEKTFKETQASERYIIEKCENINTIVAKLLADNKIVARCTGPMEFGARALGNRSILANANFLENLNVINSAIKSRDFWMPFCPSIIAEDEEKYIINPKRLYAPYMCITFNSTLVGRNELKAAVHPKDFTLRPQIVKKDWNQDFYEILSEFKKITGIGGLLNTSFNLHGEPNVCTPYDAIKTLDNSGLSILAINNFLLTKK